jgi:hypothetical protein
VAPPASRVGFAAAPHRQVVAHRRRQRHRFEQVAKVTEGVGLKQVQVVGGAEGRPTPADAFDRDHHDLAQRVDHALAQLVGAGQEFAPDRVVQRCARIDEGFGFEALRAQPLDMGLPARHRELLVEPAVDTQCTHALDLDAAGTETGLRQQARRLRAGKRRRGRRWCGSCAAAAAAAGRGGHRGR